jgi:hypothetical protein
MGQCIEWEADQTINEFIKLVITLIVDDGFTEVRFRNPTTNEERVIATISILDTMI